MQRFRRSLRSVLAAGWVAFGLLGCSEKPLDANVAVDAQSAFQTASELFAAGNYDGSLEQLDVALADGGLTPDLYTEGLVKRAICFARLDRCDAALADLEIAEQGTLSLAEIRMARAYVFRKQGKTAAAKTEAAAAKKIDRRAKPWKD